MAQPARRHASPDEAPHYDPRSIQRTMLEQRARRKARVAHKRGRRDARIRFFIVILALLGGAIALGVVAWHEIQRLFGL
jgi:hypothetical protein